MSEGMQMAKRTAEHDKLNFMVGEWKTREVHAPSPWLPQGGTGEGRATYKWAVGKLCLVQEYRSKGALGEAFEGLGVETYDAARKAHVHWWFDGCSGTGMESKGFFEGSDLVHQGAMDSPEGSMKFKMVTHPVSPKEFTFIMSMEMEGKLVPGMTITYVRA